MRHRIRALLLPLVLLAAAAPAPAAAVQRLAVLTVTAPWTPDCQGVAWRKDRELRERCPVLETLADEARAGALAALDGRDVDVMTRENTAQLLKEMGASAACTAEGECEVETAKLIGADYVVSGTLTTVEGTWIVAMKLHAVRTAKLLRTSEPLMSRSQVELIVKVRATAEAMVRGGLKLGAASAAAPAPRVPAPAPPVAAPARQPPREDRVDVTPAAAPATRVVPVVVDGMARLPGGTYTSGEAKTKVTVAPFLLDVTEVTVEAYAACAEAGDCDAAPSTAYWSGISGEMKEWSKGVCNQAKPERMKHPVNCVNWKQASAYCAAMGKRLPTEEEWEWAARGGDQKGTYPWGDEPPSSQLCWGRNVGDRKATGLVGTCAVGSYPAGDSPHGVKDLAGGVWEWTSTARGDARAVRGGSWTDGDGPLVSAARTSKSDPSTRSYYYGFRCAKDP